MQLGIYTVLGTRGKLGSIGIGAAIGEVGWVVPSMFYTWVSREQAFHYRLYSRRGIGSKGILVLHVEEDEGG